MSQYVSHMNALAGTSLWQIPHREDIVLSMAIAGVLCLIAAFAVLMRPDAGLVPIRLRARITEDR